MPEKGIKIDKFENLIWMFRKCAAHLSIISSEKLNFVLLEFHKSVERVDI